MQAETHEIRSWNEIPKTPKRESRPKLAFSSTFVWRLPKWRVRQFRCHKSEVTKATKSRTKPRSHEATKAEVLRGSKGSSPESLHCNYRTQNHKLRGGLGCSR